MIGLDAEKRKINSMIDRMAGDGSGSFQPQILQGSRQGIIALLLRKIDFV